MSSSAPRVIHALGEKRWLDSLVVEVFEIYCTVFEIGPHQSVARYRVIGNYVHVTEDTLTTAQRVHPIPLMYLELDEPERTQAMRDHKAAEDRIKNEATRREKLSELNRVELRVARLRQDLDLPQRAYADGTGVDNSHRGHGSCG